MKSRRPGQGEAHWLVALPHRGVCVKVPGLLKAQLEARLKSLAKPEGYVVHYLIVLPSRGAEARVVLGGVAKSTTVAALKKAWPQDPELKGNANTWTIARGVFEGAEGQHRIHPATLGNNLLGANVRDLLKAARKTLAPLSGASNFDRLLAGRLMPAADPASFVGEIDESEMGPDNLEAPEPTDAAGRFAAQAQEVGPQIDEIVEAGLPQGETLRKVWAQIVGLAEQGDPDKALSMLERMGPSLQKAREALDPDPAGDVAPPEPTDEELFRGRLAQVGPLAQRRIGELGDQPEGKALRSRLGLALAAGKDRNFTTANDHLDAVETLLAELPEEQAAKEEAPPKAPVSRVTFMKARLTWLDARATMGTQMERLIQAMEAAAADEDPEGPFGPEAIEEMADNLRGVLSGLDDRLIWALDEALVAPTPALRARHEAQARALVEEYLRFLDAEPLFDDLDEDSGFGRFPIVESARQSLEQIATLL